MKKLLTEWRKYLKEEDEVTKWYHGSRHGLSQDLRSLYLTPSEALASLHGKVYEFAISPDAKWLNLSNSMGRMAMFTMDSVGYEEKQMELIRAEGFDIVWDSGDYARGYEQIFVLNPEMASVVEQQSREYLKEADNFDWDAFGFSDEESGESEGNSPHYDDLVGLDRGDTFTIGNRKPVYRVIGALTDSGGAKGSSTKLVVIEGSAERKSYEIRTTGEDYEVGAFGKDEDNEYTKLIGKTGFVMNITKVIK